jgi:NADH:ubiquinone reductase (H+-translocating)
LARLSPSIPIAARSECRTAARSADSLVVATGAGSSYFGHDEWARHAPGLKTIDDAMEIRRRILIAFEAAEREADPVRRAEWMTIVVVGGGPTGVELAGALGEIANATLRRGFRSIDPTQARIYLVEALDRVRQLYPPDRSAAARQQLERLGVTVQTGTRLVHVDGSSVGLAISTREKRLPSRTVLWAAGAEVSSFAACRRRGLAHSYVAKPSTKPAESMGGHLLDMQIRSSAVLPSVGD